MSDPIVVRCDCSSALGRPGLVRSLLCHSKGRFGGPPASKPHPTPQVQGCISSASRNHTTPARYQILQRRLVASTSKPSLGN